MGHREPPGILEQASGMICSRGDILALEKHPSSQEKSTQRTSIDNGSFHANIIQK